MDPDSSFKSYSHRIKAQATLLVFLQLTVCFLSLCLSLLSWGYNKISRQKQVKGERICGNSQLKVQPVQHGKEVSAAGVWVPDQITSTIRSRRAKVAELLNPLPVYSVKDLSPGNGAAHRWQIFPSQLM